jgi:hypothetical protein
VIRANGSKSGKAETVQTYNRPTAHKAKIDLRKNVLEHVAPAHVFDAFCGPAGEMWQAVWKDADSYVGCDVEYELTDPRPRFVADNIRVLRTLDLQRFNIFDIDAFGSPWTQLLVLAARRKWALGERGGVVITDGSVNKSKFGVLGGAHRQLLGAQCTMVAPSRSCGIGMGELAIQVWLRQSRVTPVRQWRAESKSSGVGSFAMVYTAIVFEGLGRTAEPDGVFVPDSAV